MFSEEAYYGSFTLPYTLLLSKRCPVPPSPFCSPDFFGIDLTWHRIASLESNLVALSVSQEGIVLWHSQNLVRHDDVREKLSQLLLPLPLPEVIDTLIPSALAKFFRSRAPLVHIASETLWEALVKGIIRQVITALQAKKVLHRFITCFGDKLEYHNSIYYAFPTIEAIIQASFDDLLACGLGFKAKTIVHLAEVLSEQKGLEDFVRVASPEEALKTLIAIKGIGNWTARVAYCDLTVHWDEHPYDLAVRYWARQCISSVEWEKSEVDFQEQFNKKAGPYVGAIMAYLLVYGSAFLSFKESGWKGI